MKLCIIFVALVVLLLVAAVWNEPLRSNLLIVLILNRGLIAPSRFWWSVSDVLLAGNQSGGDFYESLNKKYGPVIPLNIFGQTYSLLTDVDDVKQVLEHSPHTYGAGALKCKFFQTFMSKNVGISHDAQWERRRMVNEYVLMTDRVHKFVPQWDAHMDDLFDARGVPSDFDGFNAFGRVMMAWVVFALPSIPSHVFDTFNDANSLKSLFVDFDVRKLAYNTFLLEQIENPQPTSLVALGKQVERDPDELLHQIPHWIFPMVGLFNATAPRLLLLLCNHPASLEMVRNGDRQYLRQCILETLRLNNVVASTFRTVRIDTPRFRKGDRLLILNNPFMRTPRYFPQPNTFQPQRWDDPEAEREWTAIMWNQGPQRCPGKEICISLIASFIMKYLERVPVYTCAPAVDVTNISQMINPFDINITPVI